MNAEFVITPIAPILSDKQLLNGRVQYQAFAQYQLPADESNKDLLHTGIITTVCRHPVHGLMVRIVPDENELDLVAGWYVLEHHVTGWAHIETAAVVVDQPAAEAAVIATPAAAQPVAAQPAHMTDKGRCVGQINSINAAAGYGYLMYKGHSYRFSTLGICGGTSALKALRKNMEVSFATSGFSAATTLVVPGHAESEAHYSRFAARKVANKATKTAEPLPRARNARKEAYEEKLAAKAARDKAALVAALNSPLA